MASLADNIAQCLEELNVSCVTPLEESTWKLKPGFFRSASHIPHSFADYKYMWVLLVSHQTQQWSFQPLTHFNIQLPSKVPWPTPTLAD